MSTTPNERRSMALERMTDAELQAKLSAVRHTLSIIRDNERGCRYYRSIPQVKQERDRNQYLKHRIVKILERRQATPGDAIKVTQLRFAYFPKSFEWDGHSYAVEDIVRCWTVARCLWFRVSAAGNVYDLCNDAGQWTLKQGGQNVVE